jgi:hypothetical protein
MTRHSSRPITMIATGTTRTRSLSEIWLMSWKAGASPATPYAVAPRVLAAAAASARTAGTAFIAAVVDGSPAFRPVSNWIVRPSGLTYCAVARYAW